MYLLPFLSSFFQLLGSREQGRAGSREQRRMGEKIPTTNYQLPTTNYQLPITNDK
ncbi:hypothetical protein [Chroococcidiopsis sp [FACHB-1243]]|uniref:hypothetical protein n=1 Tax=Chroococcidiopsis sp. [FACHB-1243] TaxID=2692781 RepID=UPI0018EFE349|nr:hypothetical protein [Chroococcidiopsis sp. [FACHB-1243]]